MSKQSQPTVPSSFWQYIKSMGPGIIVALTWLGAGDLIDSAVAGGSYGYSLMWAMVIALFVRFIFVSIVAKYQLCNQILIKMSYKKREIKYIFVFGFSHSLQNGHYIYRSKVYYLTFF